MGCHVLLQGFFPTQQSNTRLLRLLHGQVDSLPLSHQGFPSYTLLCLKALKLGHRQPALCSVHPAMILHPNLSFLLSVSFHSLNTPTSPPNTSHTQASTHRDSYCQEGQKKKHLIINSYLELITYHLPGKISSRGKSFTSS